MSWSLSFIAKLKRSTIAPKYELRFHENPTGPGSGVSIFGGYPTSDPDEVMIDREGPSISGTSIIPGRWNVTFGGFTVPIVGDIRKLFPSVMRGAFAGLYVDLGGSSVERVAFGQLRNITGFMGRYRLEFVDLLSALAVTADATVDPTFALERFRYFYRCGRKADLTGTYVGGAALFDLDDITDFEQETGQDGLIKIDSTVHGVVYATYTGKTTTAAPAGTLTASASTRAGDTIYPGTVANLTSPSQFTIGTDVYPVALLQGKPWEIMAKLLTSRTGTSTHTYDKYPSSWCAGGNLPTDLYDALDAAQASNYIKADPTTTAYNFAIPVEGTWDSGLRTFVDLAAQTGQWPVFRQGAVSWRGARTLNDQSIPSAAMITTADIIEIVSHEFFDANTPNVYSFMTIKYQERAAGIESKTSGKEFTSSGGIIETLPTLPVNEIDNKYIYKSSDQINPDSARSHMAIGDMNRLIDWSTAPIEKIVLRMPLHFCRLCAGDMVHIVTQTRFLHGYDVSTTNNNISIRAMVTGIEFSFQDAACTLTLCTYGQMGDTT